MKGNNESEDCFLMQSKKFMIQISERIKMIINELKNFKQEQQLNTFRIEVKDSKKATLRISRQALEVYITNNSTKTSIQMKTQNNDKEGNE